MNNLEEKPEMQIFKYIYGFNNFLAYVLKEKPRNIKFEEDNTEINTHIANLKDEMSIKIKYMKETMTKLIEQYKKLVGENDTPLTLTFKDLDQIDAISKTLDEIHKKISPNYSQQSAYLHTMKMVYNLYQSIPQSQKNTFGIILSSNLQVLPEVRGIYDKHTNDYVKHSRSWISGYSITLPQETLSKEAIPLNLGQGMLVSKLPQNICMHLDSLEDKSEFFSKLYEKLSHTIANFGPFSSVSDDRFVKQTNNFPYKYPSNEEEYADPFDPYNYLGSDKNSAIYIARETIPVLKNKNKVYHTYYLFVISYSELHSMKFIRSIKNSDKKLIEICDSKKYQNLMSQCRKKRQHLSLEVLGAIMEVINVSTDSHLDKPSLKYVSDFDLSSIVKNRKLNGNTSVSVVSIHSDMYNPNGSVLNDRKKDRKHADKTFLIDGNIIRMFSSESKVHSYRRTSFPFMNWCSSSLQQFDNTPYSPTEEEINLATNSFVFVSERHFTRKKAQTHTHFNCAKNSHLGYSLNMLDNGRIDKIHQHHSEQNSHSGIDPNNYLTIEFSRYSSEIPEQSDHVLNSKFINQGRAIYCTTKSDPVVQNIILDNASDDYDSVNIFKYTVELPTDIYLKKLKENQPEEKITSIKSLNQRNTKMNRSPNNTSHL